MAVMAFAGSGWSIVNPVLGKAIVDLFPITERGIAMGIKQMGLTLGGGLSALVLPAIAAHWGWRAAVAACAAGMTVPVVFAWRPLRALTGPHAEAPRGRVARMDWWWTRRPALLVLFGAGAGGATQSGLLGGVSLAAIVIGLLAGAPTFGLVLQAFDSYGASWTVFAGLSGVVALVVAAFGAAIHRECQPAVVPYGLRQDRV